MQDSKVWLGLGSQFGFWPFILVYIIWIKCLSCQKDRCHFMKQHLCITLKIVLCDLGSDHNLDFDHLFWHTSFKLSAYHARRFCIILRNHIRISHCRIVMCDLSLDDYFGFDHLFCSISFKPSAFHARRVDVISCNQISVKWDLDFKHCLGFDHFFWPISFKSSVRLLCKKVMCHFMQNYKCITCKIILCDLGLNHYLGFDQLFWPISIKPIVCHAWRVDII